MIQKLEILNESLDTLDEINSKPFSFEKFREVNSQIEKILIELKKSVKLFLLLHHTKNTKMLN